MNFLWKNIIFLFNVVLSSHLDAFTEFRNKIRISNRFFTDNRRENWKWENGKINGRSARPMLLCTYNKKYRVTDGELIALKFHAFKL